MKNIIVTEKPSVARAFASALGVTYSSSEKGYFENNEWIITWALGHLVTMSYPEKYDSSLKKWSMETLPFLPEKYIYEPIDNPGNKKQLKVIKELYSRKDIDTLYIAGDPAREGIYLQYLIIQEAGINPNIKQKVVWIDSQTDSEIKRGIADAKDKSEYDNLAASGYLRAIEDYATGINLSRAITLKYGPIIAQNIGENHCVIAVGRVMSSVLGMVISKEREIKNFTETSYYKIGLNEGEDLSFEWKVTDKSKLFESPHLYNDTGFKEEAVANKFIEYLKPRAKDAVVVKKEEKQQKKYAPNLFNLAELQSECSKLLKLSPEQTLSVAQSLYEKKLTTYPRTDARVLSSAIASEIDKNLIGIGTLIDYKQIVDSIISSNAHKNIGNTKYTDDSKISDHYAIIPTGATSGIDKLSSIERSVFTLIIKRFLAIFMPPAIYHNTALEVKIENESFFANVKTLKSEGYLSIYPKERADQTASQKAVDAITQGDNFDVKSISIKEAKTSPPKRYSSGSIILAMENAGNLIENEEERARLKSQGIGTSATRAAILTKLERNKYIKINPKTQIIQSDNLGEMIYDALNITIKEVLSPSMTAKWEIALDAVVDGKMDFNKYMEVLNAYITKEIMEIKNTDHAKEIVEAIAPYKKEGTGEDMICPVCGRRLVKNKRGDYGCSGYKDETNPCRFYIKSTLANKKLTEKQIAWMLNHKDEPTPNKIKGFKSKSDTSFDAKLKYTYDENYRHHFEFVFEEKKTPPTETVQTSIKCPKCQNNLLANNYKFTCECGFKINRKIYGKIFTDDEMNYMLTNGISAKMDFFSTKKNKSYSAKVQYDKTTDKTTLKFD